MYVMDLAVVNRNLAYAVALDRLVQFDGSFWTQVGEGDIEGGARAVWADAETVVLAGAGAHIYAIQSGKDPVSLPGLPERMSFVAAWGFGASDLWVASADGQLFHHDGNQWSLKTSLDYGGAKYPVGPRTRLWGQGGRLFVILGNLFGRWDGTRVEILDSLDGKAYFEGLWGNSPSEVFLGVHDPDLSHACPLRARWWNGKTVGPL